MILEEGEKIDLQEVAEGRDLEMAVGNILKSCLL